ncbi:MAG: hypothetical protein NUV48_15555, partial [Peptococcaceae bacterium]|nr:hypothetical protein [Peptococcaceae bacterium]
DGWTKETGITAAVPQTVKEGYERVTYKVIPFDSGLTEEEMKTLFERDEDGFTGQVHPDEPQVECNEYYLFKTKILSYR